MDAWEYDDVEAARAASGRLYHEFLRVPDLSAGIYVIEAGGTDPQSPHTEDELYYVVAGPGRGDRRGRDAGRRPGVARLRGRRPSRTASTTSPSGSNCWSCSVRRRAIAPDAGRGHGHPARPGRPLRGTPGPAPRRDRPRRGGRTRTRRRRPRGTAGAGPPRPPAPGRCSRSAAAAGTGTSRSGGCRAAAHPRGARSCTAPPRPSAAPRTSRRRATTRPGTPSSAAGRPARLARKAASRSSSRRMPSGTRKRTVPSRSPNARYGPVSHGTLSVGSPRMRPERAAALGLDREPEVGRRGRHPGRHLRGGRRGVVGVVQLDRGQAAGVVGEESRGAASPVG